MSGLYRVGLDIGSCSVKVVVLADQQIVLEKIVPVAGRPLQAAQKALAEIANTLGDIECTLGVIGSGGVKVRQLLNLNEIHESSALTCAINTFYPDVRTVIEIGHQIQRYLLLKKNERTQRLIITDSSIGNKCASGSGSFINTMASRLNFSIEEFAKMALTTDESAKIAGRCAVFAESDIVHLFQVGTPPQMIAAGVHQAIARSFRAAVRKKILKDRIIFIGGVSENPAAGHYLKQELKLNDLTVPEHNQHLTAIGAALLAKTAGSLANFTTILQEGLQQPFDYEVAQPIALRTKPDSPKIRTTPLSHQIEKAALGIDIGSVSTKAALITYINDELKILASFYRWTEGNPLVAVRDTLAHIDEQVRESGIVVKQIVAGTTGSGRYLTGDFVGADLIANEISAQCSGAFALDPETDTILEIGGQDSKFIFMNHGVIRDFDMNRACAAGTGAYLKKQADKLGSGMENFGDLALQNSQPPLIDGTCTVFAESAIDYYLANNVPLPDIAGGICLAAVKNFMAKTLGTRRVGKKIAFQGATAFNKGMVAAFETVLGQPIYVSENPHITGAIGVARLAYNSDIAQSQFRGFQAIAGLKYSMEARGCKGCNNRCLVNSFQIEGGEKRFYGDRCEKFSGSQKKSKRGNLPDLFAEREELLMTCLGEQTTSPDVMTIGIPRGGMFEEYFPLYANFFRELGFQVVSSEPTNKHIIDLGLENVAGEPCFPFKVMHGHVARLLEQDVDMIFCPRVISAEQPNPSFAKAQTCPYLQVAPEQIGAALGLKDRDVIYLTPSLHFQQGKPQVKRAFTELALTLGKTKREANQAFEKGLEALKSFRQIIDERGRQVLADLPSDNLAFVVLGRPYTLWDPAVNMKVAGRILDLGVLAIPQDFLPLNDMDITDTWEFVYSRQIQKKLAAGRIIKNDQRLRAIVLTYFGCGPDSFANQFFNEELGESCYVMQIDEHTAEAGIITRLEAFFDTVNREKIVEPKTVHIHESPLANLEERRLWIPYANHMARALAGAMRTFGVNAYALPRSPDKGLIRARAAITEDICLPSLMTVEDMLYRISEPDFDPKQEAFFMGNSMGPCRFGMYYALMRQILDRLGHQDVEIATLGIKSTHGGLGMKFAITAWNAILTSDLLFKIMLRTRPYEREKGKSEEMFEHWLKKLEKILPHQPKNMAYGHILDLGDYEVLLRQAQFDFLRIPIKQCHKPLIGVVGEFYVRIHDEANQDILRKLEDLGAETWLAPGSEFFSYANYISLILAGDRLKNGVVTMKDIGEWAKRFVNAKLMQRAEHRLFQACLPYLRGYDDIGSKKVVQLGSLYVHPDFGGEAICSMGKAEDFARRGLNGIVAVAPFNCMPGNAVAAMSQQLRQEQDNLPFLNLSYDGYTETRREAMLAEFMAQVQERFATEVEIALPVTF